MKIFIGAIIAFVLIAGIAHAQVSDQNANIQLTLLNQDPDPARAGDTVTLHFKLQNTGGEAVSSLTIELLEDYPFTVATDSPTKSFSNIGAFQAGNNYVTFDYTVLIDKSTTQGEKALRLRFQTAPGSWETVSFPIEIITKEFAQIIYVDKANIQPGNQTPMTFTITNLGSAPLQNLVFSWDEPTGKILPVFSSDTKYIRYLDVGQSVDVTYTVIADINANPGLYQLNLKLVTESTTNTTTSTLETKAGVFVGGETDFDVAFSESTAGQTSLSIANIGNNPAQSVSVSIPQQPGYRVTGTTSSIIGNLDKGDYTIVSFQIVSMAQNVTQRTGAQQAANSQQAINPQQGANGQQFRQLNRTGLGSNLRVEIDYTDTTGQRQTVQKDVPVQFRGTGAATGTTAAQGFGTARRASTPSWWLIGGGALVLVVIAFFIGSRRGRRAGKRT